MKPKILIAEAIICILLFNATTYAWTGDRWGSTSRQTITSIASEMIDSYWTPKSTIHNWAYGSVWYYFYSGTTYRGEAYCQQNPQENWAEFFNLVDNTAGGDTYYGNDCSGFASISWRLPKRYTCTDFECDAINSTNPSCGPYYNPSTDNYAQSLGNIGGGGQVTLLQGDALVKSGYHIILFDRYAASGIISMEQTPGPRLSSDEMRRPWSWTSLNSYRPIRRNLIGGPPLSGDWDGDGDDTFGYFENNVFYLDNGQSFGFGLPGDYPIAGDWDGDGKDDVGVFRAKEEGVYQATFYLELLNDGELGGSADYTIPFGYYPNNIPVVGDWDGDGDDDIAGYNPANSTFYLYLLDLTTSTASSYINVPLGESSDYPISGDWDADGDDDLGVFRAGDPNENTNNFYFDINLTGYEAEYDVTDWDPSGYGDIGDIPVIGDWDGDGDDNIGVYRPSNPDPPWNKFYTNPSIPSIVPPSVTISGYVRKGDNSPISGVVMSGLPGNPSTNSSGYYSGTVDYGWSGTVTPSKTGYTFSPPNRSYTNVTSDQSNQNYTGTLQTFTISGYVRKGDNSPISGVTINGLPGSPVTNGSGYYSATVDYGWSGTATPNKTGYTFSPSNRSYSNVTSDQPNQNYTGTLLLITIENGEIVILTEPKGGRKVKFQYTINNPTSSSATVTLGAQIRRSGGSEWYDDYAGDETVSVPPGVSYPERSYHIPPNGNVPYFIEPGPYDARWVIYNAEMADTLPKLNYFTVQPFEVATLDNGTIEVGVNLDWGGVISAINYQGTNLIDTYDPGRFAQVSFWDGDDQTWNPVQAGDRYGNASPVVDQDIGSESIYTKTRLLNYAESEDITDVYLEQTVTLVGPTVIRVHYKMIYEGTESHDLWDQEFPTAYINGSLTRLITYAGGNPWNNDPITEYAIPPNNQDFYFTANEYWASFVNAQDIGLTLFSQDKIDRWLATRFNSTTEPSHLTTIPQFAVIPGTVKEAMEYYIAGDYRDARAYVYDLLNPTVELKNALQDFHDAVAGYIDSTAKLAAWVTARGIDKLDQEWWEKLLNLAASIIEGDPNISGLSFTGNTDVLLSNLSSFDSSFEGYNIAPVLEAVLDEMNPSWDVDQKFEQIHKHYTGELSPPVMFAQNRTYQDIMNELDDWLNTTLSQIPDYLPEGNNMDEILTPIRKVTVKIIDATPRMDYVDREKSFYWYVPGMCEIPNLNPFILGSTSKTADHFNTNESAYTVENYLKKGIHLGCTGFVGVGMVAKGVVMLLGAATGPVELIIAPGTEAIYWSVTEACKFAFPLTGIVEGLGASWLLQGLLEFQKVWPTDIGMTVEFYEQFLDGVDDWVNNSNTCSRSISVGEPSTPDIELGMFDMQGSATGSIPVTNLDAEKDANVKVFVKIQGRKTGGDYEPVMIWCSEPTVIPPNGSETFYFDYTVPGQHVLRFDYYDADFVIVSSGGVYEKPPTSFKCCYQPFCFIDNIGDILLEGKINIGDIIPTVINTSPQNVETEYVLPFEGSDLDLHLYDESGRHVGKNYNTGDVEIEIPGATYSGPSSNPEVIWLPGGGGERCSVEVIAIETEGEENYALILNEIYEHPATITCIPSSLSTWGYISDSALVYLELIEVGGQSGVTDIQALFSDLVRQGTDTIYVQSIHYQLESTTVYPDSSVSIFGYISIPPDAKLGQYIGTLQLTSSANSITVPINLEIKSSTGVREDENEEEKVLTFVLHQNYPNPFNPNTAIRYTLSKDCQVKIAIYNILGQKVRTLIDQYQNKGQKKIYWDGKDDQGDQLASGIYFYHLQAGGFSETKKMVLLR